MEEIPRIEGDKIVYESRLKDPNELAGTIGHEDNHLAGQGHPWESGQPADIAQYGQNGYNPAPYAINVPSGVTNETIKTNLQNSAGNPIPYLKTTGNERSTLTLGQVKAIDKKVQEETRPKN